MRARKQGPLVLDVGRERLESGEGERADGSAETERTCRRVPSPSSRCRRRGHGQLFQ